MPYTYLTSSETKHVKTGYRHLVDNGYSTLVTAQDVLRTLEVAFLDWERDCRVGEAGGFKSFPCQAIILAHLMVQFKALSVRAPPSDRSLRQPIALPFAKENQQHS
jgi:hypothetical protein